jgi:hypothetical protein
MGEWMFILTSALVGGEWSASRPGCFTTRKRAPDTHWIEGWLGPRRRGEEKILDPTGTRTPTPRCFLLLTCISSLWSYVVVVAAWWDGLVWCKDMAICTWLLQKTQLQLCQSLSYVKADGQSTSLFRYKDPSGTQDWIFVTARQLQVCWCGAPSLTLGGVCRLQLLLALASAVILESESCDTHYHILLSQIRDSPNLEGQVPVFISPGTGFLSRRLLRFAGLRWRYRNRLHTDFGICNG